jgi:hypothetical protein
MCSKLKKSYFWLGTSAILLMGILCLIFISAPEQQDTGEIDRSELAPPWEAPDQAQTSVALEVPNLPTGVSTNWWAEASRYIADSEYEVSANEGVLQAPNRAQNLRTTFRESGIEVRPRDLRITDWSFTWSLTAWGREDRLESVSATRPFSDAHRVEYRRPGFVEWYDNTEQGLEQGFTVAAAPEGEGHLCFEGRLGGDLEAALQDDGQAIAFLDEGSARVLQYSKLVAWDATGRELPGQMALADGAIRLSVDDTGAEYPIVVDPLLNTPHWYADGIQGYGTFGGCVATAGDVNGDGYSDVLVGAPSVGTNHGGAYLFLGSASGLETEFHRDWYGDDDYANFGESVASAGDVNGDGYDDIIIGAGSYTDNYSMEGCVFLYYGGPNGPGWIEDRSILGDEAGAHFGKSVAGAGDVNADGYADIIIGAYGESLAYVYLGSDSGLETDWSWRGGESIPGTQFGYCVAAAGDVDGNGYDDVIVGAPYYHTAGTFGHVYVYYGSAGGVIDAPQWDVGGTESFSYYAWTVATAGDVNGDGYSDVLVGAMSYSGDVDLEGRAFLYHGSATGPSDTPDWTDEGGQINCNFGKCVATAGDINADGYSDVLVAADDYTNGQPEEGRVYLYMGHYDGLSADPVWFTEGGADSLFYGLSTATAGDVNGDGFSDIIIGIPRWIVDDDPTGRAVVFHGLLAGPRTQAGWVTESGQINGNYGTSVACVGDVDGNGFSDVLVGASGYDNGQVDEGVVFLFLGSRTGLSWIPIWWAEANQAGAFLGTSVSGSGDVNGDGYPEAIVGAPGYTNTINDEGAAFIWFSVPGGAPLGTPDNANWSAFGEQADGDFGFAVAGGGDFNGDGYSDVLVGAPYYDIAATNDGCVFVYFGSDTGPSATWDWRHGSGFPNCEYGISVAADGDFNADGYSDVLVGAPKYYVGENLEGWAFVYIGSEDGPVGGPPWWNCMSNQNGARLGSCVAWAGDINGDGDSEVLVGAPRWDGPYTNCGKVLIWGGNTTLPPDGTPDNTWWSASYAQENAWFGYAVASAGDVNGDGYSDILVGSPFIDTSAGENAGKAFIWAGSETGLVLGAAAWSAEGQQANCNFAWDLASAGDVNGDGFSDVVVGARNYDNGQSDEGRAFCYYGNNSRGLPRTPEQWRSDLSAPIAPLCVSDSPSSFALKARGRSPEGRGRIRLEYEVEPFGTPFDGNGTVLGSWIDTGAPADELGSFVAMSTVVSGLNQGTHYHWRLRFLSDNPLFPRSPWLTMPYNGGGEADLLTAGDPGTGVSDLPVAAVRLQSYPNPFNPKTKLVYNLPAQVHVRLKVYDVRGRLVRTLVDGVQVAGAQAVVWDGRNESGRALASGVYFARLHAGELTRSLKLLLVK